uniref:Monooxygenase n=1 Tax=Coccidioides posadasii RMSCC 3488 TaxID=454284 RepID=A0A0J6F7F8_COCPO|nr:hypothetical protein CPAG_01576 [Coccidioides posadasii RMSCC 3488]
MERDLSIGHIKEKKLGFDPDALTAKYLAERNKRLRKDGIDQYKAAEGKLRHYKDDLYAEPGFQRLPVVEDVDVLIIGGGFGGQLAALPGIHGIGTFKGYSFHTSRRNYGYTGGNSNGGLYKLSEKRVGVIGTGATAIQIISHLGRSAKHLYVF